MLLVSHNVQQRGHEHVGCYVRMLFGLEDEFASWRSSGSNPTGEGDHRADGTGRVRAQTAGCSAAVVKDRPLMRMKDLPVVGSERPAVVAQAPADLQRGTVSAADIHPDVGGGAGAGSGDRAAAGASGEGDRGEQPGGLGGRRRVRGVVADRASRRWSSRPPRWLPEPEPTTRLGIDETRFRSVRWILDGITWRRSDPWLTSFVDCSRDGPGSLLGLAPGRTGACVREWLGEQTEQFRKAIQIVVIDPSAPYASGIRAALPDAKIAVDKWHLVALANQMVTEVRQRVTRDLLGRRGTVADPVWVNRRLLLTGAEHLSPEAVEAARPRCSTTAIRPTRSVPPGV